MPACWHGPGEIPPRPFFRARPKWDFPWAVFWFATAVWASGFVFLLAHRQTSHLEAAHQLAMDSLSSLPPDTVWALPAGWSEAYQLQCYWLPPDTEGTDYTVIRQQEHSP